MNSLLPLNEKQELHLLDDYFGSRIDNLNNLNLEVHPLFTEEKYLKLLSYILEIDITGLSENEARELLSLFVELKKYAGTVYILKKIISIFFNDVALNDQIGNYLFDLNVEMKNDVSAEKLNRIKELANKYKNVRSKLRNIIINLPLLETEIKLGNACLFGLELNTDSLMQGEFKTDLQVKNGVNFRTKLNTDSLMQGEFKTDLQVKNGVNFRIKFNTNSKLGKFKTEIKEKGGILWRL